MPEASIESAETMVSSIIESGLVRTCRAQFGAGLRAVILTGSVARDEGSYLSRDGRWILLGDVEAVVVLHLHTPLPSRQDAESVCRQTEEQLASGGVSAEVSLSFVYGCYLRQLPPHIYSYELRACGRVLEGSPTILEEIPHCLGSDLSQEDAWHMLSNRLIEQMEPMEKARDGVVERYRAIKLCLDLASSTLVFVGRFEAGYRARVMRMEEFARNSKGEELPIPLEDFLKLLRACTSAKLNPVSISELEDNFPTQVTAWAWRVWLWELSQLSDRYQNITVDRMIRSASPGGVMTRLRGWLYVARRVGWWHSARYWPRWGWLFASGLTPRHAIYLSAYRWFRDCGDQKMKAALRFLPVIRSPLVSAGTDGPREIVWNYKEFAAETRA